MITDKLLDKFLATTTVLQPQLVMLTIGNQGENLVNWQVNFNRLTLSEMYNEYKNIVNQLMVAQLDEQQRLVLMDKVFKIASRMFVSLKQIYQNQTGFLDESQQQALDTVLSSYYLTMMFYHSVWQRVAATPVMVEKKGLSSLLSRQKEDISDRLIQECLYGMMSLLREALFEKYLGYRCDVTVLWKYLNKCYRFTQINGWQSIKGKYSSAYLSSKSEPSLQQIYCQCVLAHIVNPYACRRPDMIALYEKSLDWSHDLIVSADKAERPYLFVNLLGDEAPQLQHAGMAFNPFAKGNECIFINLIPLIKRLQHEITTGQQSDNPEVRLAARHAKIIAHNIASVGEPPTDFAKIQDKCQVVVGFHQIHYVLANKSSLSNLIQGHTLPERLRPRNQNLQQLNQITSVNLIGSTNNKRHLAHKFSYQPFENISHYQQARSIEFSNISQFQVQSLIAIRQVNDSNKIWQLGKVTKIQQTPIENSDSAFENIQTTAVDLHIEAWVNLFGANIVPCGVRLQNSGSRPPYFVPALIIPKNQELQHEKPSLMMARFGFNVGDKLIIRIDSKEVNICLTELLNLTDDIEEYAFVRLQ